LSYDGLSREVKRVEKESGSVVSTKQFVWCGHERCEERDGSNNVTKQFYSQGVKIGSASYYYTKDHLGSIRELSDGSGTIHARYDYDPYGRRSANSITTNPVEADFGFTGYYTNSQWPDLAFSPKRVYSSDLARFISPDPIEEHGGINLQAYVYNNPINLTDPMGLCVGDWYDPSTWFNQEFVDSWIDSSLDIGDALGSAIEAPFEWNWFPKSTGLSLSGDVTVATPVGGHAEAIAGGGGFFDQGSGAYFSHGESAGPLGVVSPQNPESKDPNFNPHIGLYAGGGLGFWLSNASAASDLRNTKRTISFNVGFGVDAGISVSYGNGIWIANVVPPGPSAGGFVSISSQRTTTYSKPK
jgi:RHS repeat-associated protein